MCHCNQSSIVQSVLSELHSVCVLAAWHSDQVLCSAPLNL